MRIISFGWTTPALEAKVKTVTRRTWDRQYALQFERGHFCQGWDRSPRVKGSRMRRIIKLSEDPVYEPLAKMPDDDYMHEGFQYIHDHPDLITPNMERMFGDFSFDYFDIWRRSGGRVWVIRFGYPTDDERARYRLPDDAVAN